MYFIFISAHDEVPVSTVYPQQAKVQNCRLCSDCELTPYYILYLKESGES